MIKYVFKPKRKGNRSNPNYRGRYKLHGDRTIAEVPLGTADKRIAQQRLDQHVRQIEDERAGIIAPAPLREGAQKLMARHLDDFMADLKSRASPKYAENIGNRSRRLIEECGWNLPKNVTSDTFVAWRARQKKAAKTLNEYLDAANVLLNWLVSQKRIVANPLDGSVKRVPTMGHEKRKRRAFTDEEMRQILKAAGKYATSIRVAYRLGLRRREASLLQWGDLHLDGPKPYVVLRGATTKNRKTVNMELGDLSAELGFIRPANAKAEQLVFGDSLPTMKKWKTILKKAGVPFLDSRGRQGDFHALRYTLCTKLAQAGVAVQTAMLIMRHSDIRLTTKTYLDAGQLPVTDAMNLVPSFIETVGQPSDEIGSQTGSQTGVSASPAMSQADTDAEHASACKGLGNEEDRRKVPPRDTRGHSGEKSSAGRTRSYFHSHPPHSSLNDISAFLTMPYVDKGECRPPGKRTAYTYFGGKQK